MPSAWRTAAAPTLAQDVDSTIYELHIRDYSMSDAKVPAAERGSYLAFADERRRARAPQGARQGGTQHACTCCRASTSPRSRRTRPSRQTPQCDLASYAPDSDRAAEVRRCRREQGRLQLGLRPVPLQRAGRLVRLERHGGRRRVARRRVPHHGRCPAPGRPARRARPGLQPHGGRRARRDKSVLDKVVPGYYQRLNATGAVETSTCCQNVATEHAMAREAHGRLGRDVGPELQGRRLPLRPHGPPQQGQHARRALGPRRPDARRRTASTASPSTSTARAGTSARSPNNKLFVQATQGQLGGTGIGTFSDRLRDGVRGGGPFDEDPRKQGFGSGEATDPNGASINADAAKPTRSRQRHRPRPARAGRQPQDVHLPQPASGRGRQRHPGRLQRLARPATPTSPTRSSPTSTPTTTRRSSTR